MRVFHNPSSKLKVLMLIGSWAILVLPLTTLGFGSDGDAWRVCRAAERMWLTGEYVKSRTTGFPLLEILSTPAIHYGGWYLSNLIAFMFGLGFIAAIFAMKKAGMVQNLIPVLLSTAFLPIFVKNASSTMDYVPAVCLLTWAYYCLVMKNYLFAGVLIGVAAGFRPTSAVLLLPAWIYLFLEREKPSRILQFAVTGIISALICFSPSLIEYGIPDYRSSISIERNIKILRGGYYFFTLYGLLQSIILLAALGSIILNRRKTINKWNSASTFFLTGIASFLILFLFRPDEPEYLLPIVPLIALFLDLHLKPACFFIVVLGLLSYHLIRVETLGGESGFRKIEVSISPGYTILDIQKRREILQLRDSATRFRVSKPTLLMIGDIYIATLNEKWIYDEKYRLYRQRNGLLFLSGRIRKESRLIQLKKDGFAIMVSNDGKWEYVRTNNPFWRKYVEIIANLPEFLGISDPVNVR
jgi:hypothetical protein